MKLDPNNMLVGLFIYKKLHLDFLVDVILSVDLIKYLWGYLIMFKKKNGSGLHRVCVTHLSFADDIQVFSDGSPASLRETMMVFAEFAIISGLRINASKSAVFVGGRSQ